MHVLKERNVRMTVNEQMLQGHWNEIKGKLRERWGHLSGDELEMTHGNVDQLVGTIQRQTGETRESVERYLEQLINNGSSVAEEAAATVRQYAQATQQSIQATADQAVQAAKAGYARTGQVVKERPLESLAVCFGVGLITGVVAGLALRSR
jgi:uncharacterized protein YjbJ (UPF0337 family)